MDRLTPDSISLPAFAIARLAGGTGAYEMELLALFLGPLLFYAILAPFRKANQRSEIYDWLHKRHKGY